MLFCCPLAVGSDLNRREIWDLNRNYYFEGHKSWESKVSGLVQSYRRSLEVWSKERRRRNLSGSRIYGRSGAGGDYQRNEWRRHIIRWDAWKDTPISGQPRGSLMAWADILRTLGELDSRLSNLIYGPHFLFSFGNYWSVEQTSFGTMSAKGETTFRSWLVLSVS